MKGLDKFREKIPAFSGNRILMLPAYFLLVIAAALSVLIAFDFLPAGHGVNPVLATLAPLLGELIVGSLGFMLIFQMWHWRKKLKAKYKALSYQHIFIAGFTGVLCVISLAANMFIPFWAFAPGFWAGSWLATPIEAYAGAFAVALFWARLALALAIVLTGIAMMLRALLTFGFDYMAVIYLYFPEESRMQKSRIFSIVRNPTYAGLLTVALGGMFFTFTPYSIVLFLLFLAGFYAHVHFVEEKELIERFGKSYEDYRKSVPAFFISPENWGELFNYLRGSS